MVFYSNNFSNEISNSERVNDFTNEYKTKSNISDFDEILEILH